MPNSIYIFSFQNENGACDIVSFSGRSEDNTARKRIDWCQIGNLHVALRGRTAVVRCKSKSVCGRTLEGRKTADTELLR